MSEKKKIVRSASLMSLATFISRILGFIRDMIIAGFFGATGLSDTFFVAFRIPNLLRELFAEGSMSSALIPVLTEYKTLQDDAEVRKLVRITFTFIFLFVGALCVLGIWAAPLLVEIIAPGFKADIHKFDQTVHLTRIMFPFLLFVSLAALVMGALNTKKVFFVPAMASAWFNIIIIIIILSFYSYFKEPVILAAIAITVGGLFQFLSQLPSFFKNNYSLKPLFNFTHQGLKKIGILVLPATVGLSITQINIFISTILASYLPSGSVTYLYYAMRLIHFPVGIFGVAMSMAVLPTLSAYAANKDFVGMREDFSFSLRMLFAICIPAMTGLIVLAEPIVNLLFQRGEFDYNGTKGTVYALFFYSLGIWSIVGVKLLTATFYSMQDTKTPVKIAALSLLINIAASLALMTPLKHGGLALANTIASGANFFLLFYFLKRKLKSIDTRRIVKSFVRITVSSIIMAVAGWFMINSRAWSMEGDTLSKTLYLSVTIIVSVSVFSASEFFLKGEELRYLLYVVRKRGDRHRA